MYPELITIGDNVTLGSYSMLFAHNNPTPIDKVIMTKKYKEGARLKLCSANFRL